MPDIKDVLIDTGIDPGRRGETLSMDEFAILAAHIHRINEK
jgi:hypothetical protein